MWRRFYDTLFHTCLYRTGMGLPEPGLSPMHRVFWGPQDARVTHLSRSISCIGQVDTRADSCDGIHWQQGVQEHMGSEEDQVITCSGLHKVLYLVPTSRSQGLFCTC